VNLTTLFKLWWLRSVGWWINLYIMDPNVCQGEKPWLMSRLWPGVLWNTSGYSVYGWHVGPVTYLIQQAQIMLREWAAAVCFLFIVTSFTVSGMYS